MTHTRSDRSSLTPYVSSCTGSRTEHDRPGLWRDAASEFSSSFWRYTDMVARPGLAPDISLEACIWPEGSAVRVAVGGPAALSAAA